MQHYTPHEQDLINRGLARLHRGRLIPVMRGADDRVAEDETVAEVEEPLFPILPEDIAEFSDGDLEAFVEQALAALDHVSEDPSEHVGADYTADDLVRDARATHESLRRARSALAERVADADVEEVDEADVTVIDDTTRAALSDIAALAHEEPEAEATVEVEAEAVVEAEVEQTAVTAATTVPNGTNGRTGMQIVQRPLGRPARSSRSAPRATRPRTAITAAAGAVGVRPGSEFADENEVADAVIRRRREFGIIAAGTKGEKIPIARADWREMYEADRRLGGDVMENQALIASVIDHKTIRAEMDRRKRLMNDGVLVAAGTICAPLTPYYDLAMFSTADRPVRAGLASFGADRGGIRFAPPPRLSTITTGVGSKTASQDAAGGTFEVKACQQVVCPTFEDAEVQFIYHCLEFKNLTARTYPELVAHWNNLALAAQARLAETALLDGIQSKSTAVTAANGAGLGASAWIPGQMMAARAGMISRHRMAQDTVMRVLLPSWSVPLFISDVIRSQFDRFDTDEAKVIALLRSLDIEPTFYLDGASGAGQVFGAQGAGALLGFPTTMRWYMFPEGSFLFLDGGTLELGVVRDSTLNSTNNYQIFGETFESVAFVGIESLAITSNVCDSGTVSLPKAVTCPVTY